MQAEVQGCTVELGIEVEGLVLVDNENCVDYEVGVYDYAHEMEELVLDRL